MFEYLSNFKNMKKLLLLGVAIMFVGCGCVTPTENSVATGDCVDIHEEVATAGFVK